MFNTRARTYVPRLRPWFIGGGASALALASIVLFREATVWGVRPDVLTLFALYHVWYGNERGRYIPCMAIGLVRDLFSMGPLGTYAILYGVMHRLLSPHRRAFSRSNAIALIITALAAVVGVNLGYHAAMVAAGHGVGWWGAFDVSFRVGVASAPLMPAMVWTLTALLTRFGVERMPGGVMNV